MSRAEQIQQRIEETQLELEGINTRLAGLIKELALTTEGQRQAILTKQRDELEQRRISLEAQLEKLEEESQLVGTLKRLAPGSPPQPSNKIGKITIPPPPRKKRMGWAMTTAVGVLALFAGCLFLVVLAWYNNLPRLLVGSPTPAPATLQVTAEKVEEKIGSPAQKPATATTDPTTPIAAEFVINQQIGVATADFITTLQTVNVLPNGSMRWNFEFWNKTGKAQEVNIKKSSHVVDDLGKRYAVVKELYILLQAGERGIESVEFEAPQPGAKEFTLYWGNEWGVRFSNPVVKVSQILNPGPTPEPSPTPAGAIGLGQAIGVAPPEFEVKLLSIQPLSGQAMRWNFEFWNKTGQAQEVNIKKSSYVVDDLGKRYGVIKDLALKLQAGERGIESVEFEAPQLGAKEFTLYWGNEWGVRFSNPVVKAPVPALSKP